MDNRAPQVEAVIIIFLILSWVSVTLRCWVRTKIIKAFAYDDWLTLISLVSGFVHITRMNE